MKKIWLVIFIIILTHIFTGCVETKKQVHIYDIELAALRKYDIVKWYNTGTQVISVEFEVSNEDNMQNVIDNFVIPNYGRQPNPFENHKFFLSIGKNSKGEFKYIFYNLSVKKNASVEDVIGCSDYTLNYNIMDLLETASSLKTQEIGDYIIELVNSKNFTLSLDHMKDGILAIINNNDQKMVEINLFDGQTIIDVWELIDDNYTNIYSSKSDYQV